RLRAQLRWFTTADSGREGARPARRLSDRARHSAARGEEARRAGVAVQGRRRRRRDPAKTPAHLELVRDRGEAARDPYARPPNLVHERRAREAVHLRSARVRWEK